MGIGQSITRVDAYDKVTGRAKYTDDLAPQNALIAKVVRSSIANGRVLSFDVEQALAVPGVVNIFTCFDAPQHGYPTAGHPWSVEASHQDIADRRLLTDRVRIYGDDIAVVVAENALAAEKAARLVQVEYEEKPAFTGAKDTALNPQEPLHEAFPNNILKEIHSTQGEFSLEELSQRADVTLVQAEYDTQVVQHSHIEVPVSYAYMEAGRIVVVSSTQIPHIVRRVIGQALDMPFGMIRVIKPYIGGGFGNKQEVLYEPLCAWLTYKLGGRVVKIELTREETFSCTRTRHAMNISLQTAVRKDGRMLARTGDLYSNKGGYASHGFSITGNASSAFRMMYPEEMGHDFKSHAVLTNISTSGAMRGYGIPQMVYALECHTDDIALQLGMDPLEVRKLNCMKEGHVDGPTGITCHSTGLLECIEKGRKALDWDAKRRAYAGQTGPIRRGIGAAIFSYKTGTHPVGLETAAARIILNQDGSVCVHMGATEIGQGADTVFTQMAAETIGISEDKVHIQTTQDTDTTPFDTGAYASRQTYVSGMALKQTAEIFREKVLAYAAKAKDKTASELNIVNNTIVDHTGACVVSMADLALEAFYSLEDSVHLAAESTHHCKDNTYSFGVCFAEIEVDIPVGKIHVLNIINVHDCGILINPQLAQAQVHGGMSMGLGYGLSEQLLFADDARPLNGNLLDYKLPTSMDTPELQVDFVETNDPTGPYGNKSLGEPPCIPVAPALRNAVLHATGVQVNRLPMNPQCLVEHFTEAGLISAKTKGGA